MRKKIVIDDVSNPKKNYYQRLIGHPFFEWLLYMLCYTVVLITVSFMFKKHFYINLSYCGGYAFLASIIIYVLNQTIKPVLVYITLPITALTMGWFYPIINVFILYLTSFLLGSNFQIEGIVLPFLIAIVISVLNMFMEGMIIKPIVHKRRDKYE